MSRAFTIIELLVVIAIIAILAGILFPIFAQAEVSAKRTASLVNVKQITLASLMYSSDSDDGLPLFANGNALEIGWAGSPVETWVGTTQPYIKSLRILVDPLMGDPHGIFTGGAEDQTWNQNAYPDYGVNYVYLAPWLRDPATGLCSQSAAVYSSAADHPSRTIFYTTTYEPNEDANGVPVGGYSDYGDFAVTAPGSLQFFQSSETRCVATGMDWTRNPGTFNGGRPFTAEASQRYNSGSIDAILDGHARYFTQDESAAGTNWGTAPYLQTQIIDPDRYWWSF